MDEGREGEREEGGSCNSEWTALHWQDKIRIDSLITASLSKQQRKGEIDWGWGTEGWGGVE